jgi:hypothetical protein
MSGTANAGSLSEWLTIEPPADQTVVLRDVVITW